nr:immunoglobulin heavy chain junction region [Macaca mulatta]MOV48908.1 immunoglobulin heavy chain junction region [Macaca mulatta]MOV49988.1 immunoglobulin heavy chain junction region [Macaca mulatta]MOV51597.1 immunoglobulin heavy chain junction region [Macaca mulatta]MOV51901.1 immunoglobulin heavy chain junction region [Macaca mulatta]
CSRVNTEFDSW